MMTMMLLLLFHAGLHGIDVVVVEIVWKVVLMTVSATLDASFRYCCDCLMNIRGVVVVVEMMKAIDLSFASPCWVIFLATI